MEASQKKEEDKQEDVKEQIEQIAEGAESQEGDQAALEYLES